MGQSEAGGRRGHWWYGAGKIKGSRGRIGHREWIGQED